MMVVLSVSGVGSVAFADEIPFSMEGLVFVTVYESEDEILTAMVPEDKVEEYENRLENEAGYRESQIAMIIGAHAQ